MTQAANFQDRNSALDALVRVDTVSYSAVPSQRPLAQLFPPLSWRLPTVTV